jgi:DNA-binding Lrp family transcriptional regulator
MDSDHDETEQEILRLLGDTGALGFSEIVESLRARVAASSPKISRRLRSLVDQGIVERTVTADWPPRTLYALHGTGGQPPSPGAGKARSMRGKEPKADRWHRMPTVLRGRHLPILLSLFLAVCLAIAFCAILQDREHIRSLKTKIRLNEEQAGSIGESLHTASRLLEDITEKLRDTNLALEDRTSELVQLRSQLAALESTLASPVSSSLAKVEIGRGSVVQTGYPRVPSWQPSQPEGTGTD